MYLSIIFFPLRGFIFAGFFGRFIGGLGSARIATFNVAFSFFVSLYIFYEVALSHTPCIIRLGP